MKAANWEQASVPEYAPAHKEGEALIGRSIATKSFAYWSRLRK